VLSEFFEKSGENTCADKDRLIVFWLYFIPANDPGFYTRRWAACLSRTKIIKPVKGYVAKGKS
jgi:hypothetical protein